MENNKVSIIIRTTDDRFDLLEKAIFSLYCNDYPYIEAIIVYQGQDNNYLNDINNLKNIYSDMPVKILQNTKEKDCRAENLNIGIKNACGRYIGFLDDDDTIAQNHISTLVNLMQKEDKPWACSQCCLDIEENNYLLKKDYPFLFEKFSFKKLWEKNYIPIHSFLLDRTKIEKDLLYFEEKVTRCEDYIFLLNLAARYEPAVSNKVTCFYRIRIDNINSNIDLVENVQKSIIEYDKMKKPWNDAQFFIDKHKDHLIKNNFSLKELITDKQGGITFKTKLGKKKRFILNARIERLF